MRSMALNTSGFPAFDFFLLVQGKKNRFISKKLAAFSEFPRREENVEKASK
jgi:hypothetical protein